MIPYRNDKIQNAIAFFAKEHKKKTRKVLYQTFLYKYLAFFDFWSLREKGRPALDLEYSAMKRGPVPIEIYGNKEEKVKYKFVKDERGGEFIVAKQDPDMDFFSPYEKELLQKLIEIFAMCWVTTGVVSDVSHEDILAWKRTWANRPNASIDYALEFEGDLFSKKDDQLTFPEQAFLTYKALSY